MRPPIPESRRAAFAPGAAARRAGFALPLALFALVALALLVAIVLDVGVLELRVARGDVALARAEATAQSALADLLSSPADSGLVSDVRGVTITFTRSDGADTAFVALQSLGARTVRAVVNARSWSGATRANAPSLAFLRVLPDSSGASGALRLRRLPGWWWAPAR